MSKGKKKGRLLDRVVSLLFLCISECPGVWGLCGGAEHSFGVFECSVKVDVL